MDREISDRNILDLFCEDFCGVVEKYCRYIIVSGFLVIASGRIRGTEDIDMIMERLTFAEFKPLFNDLIAGGYQCIQSDSAETVYEYLADNVSVRFSVKGKPTPEMEVKFAKDPLDEYQLRNRVKLELTGLNVWWATVNGTIAFKEELLKSPKDLEDARHLRIMYKEIISEEEIKQIKQMIRRYRL